MGVNDVSPTGGSRFVGRLDEGSHCLPTHKSQAKTMADGSGSLRQVLLDLTGTTVNIHLLTTAVTYTGGEIVADGTDLLW